MLFPVVVGEKCYQKDGKTVKIPWAHVENVFDVIRGIAQQKLDNGELLWHSCQKKTKLYFQISEDHGGKHSVFYANPKNVSDPHNKRNYTPLFISEGKDDPVILRDIGRVFFAQINSEVLDSRIILSLPKNLRQLDHHERPTPIYRPVVPQNFAELECCSNCCRGFKTAKGLQQHREMVHEPKHLATCDKEKLFVQRTENPRRYFCPVDACDGKKFRKFKFLVQHFKQNHIDLHVKQSLCVKR